VRGMTDDLTLYSTSRRGRIWVVFIFVNKMLYWNNAKTVAVNGSQAVFLPLIRGLGNSVPITSKVLPLLIYVIKHCVIMV
jgi:hypothetical protein